LKYAKVNIEATQYRAQQRREESMDKWRCIICGYVYDPEIGDLNSGTPPGTPFEQLADTWICPVCGAPKDQFEKVQ